MRTHLPFDACAEKDVLDLVGAHQFQGQAVYFLS